MARRWKSLRSSPNKRSPSRSSPAHSSPDQRSDPASLSSLSSSLSSQTSSPSPSGRSTKDRAPSESLSLSRPGFSAASLSLNLSAPPSPSVLPSVVQSLSCSESPLSPAFGAAESGKAWATMRISSSLPLSAPGSAPPPASWCSRGTTVGSPESDAPASHTTCLAARARERRASRFAARLEESCSTVPGASVPKSSPRPRGAEMSGLPPSEPPPNALELDPRKGALSACRAAPSRGCGNAAGGGARGNGGGGNGDAKSDVKSAGESGSEVGTGGATPTSVSAGRGAISMALATGEPRPKPLRSASSPWPKSARSSRVSKGWNTSASPRPAQALSNRAARAATHLSNRSALCGRSLGALAALFESLLAASASAEASPGGGGPRPNVRRARAMNSGPGGRMVTPMQRAAPPLRSSIVAATPNKGSGDGATAHETPLEAPPPPLWPLPPAGVTLRCMVPASRVWASIMIDLSGRHTSRHRGTGVSCFTSTTPLSSRGLATSRRTLSFFRACPPKAGREDWPRMSTPSGKFVTSRIGGRARLPPCRGASATASARASARGASSARVTGKTTACLNASSRDSKRSRGMTEKTSRPWLKG
mmetsp:Transcript_19908/g.45112  ORF Transcript_19908/g.45112 Transcript_19908/m.45112 type:complete len:594 (-) Transcript_19908:210-1991(-)